MIDKWLKDYLKGETKHNPFVPFVIEMLKKNIKGVGYDLIDEYTLWLRYKGQQPAICLKGTPEEIEMKFIKIKNEKFLTERQRRGIASAYPPNSIDYDRMIKGVSIPLPFSHPTHFGDTEGYKRNHVAFAPMKLLLHKDVVYAYNEITNRDITAMTTKEITDSIVDSFNSYLERERFDLNLLPKKKFLGFGEARLVCVNEPSMSFLPSKIVFNEKTKKTTLLFGDAPNYKVVTAVQDKEDVEFNKYQGFFVAMYKKLFAQDIENMPNILNKSYDVSIIDSVVIYELFKYGLSKNQVTKIIDKISNPPQFVDVNDVDVDEAPKVKTNTLYTIKLSLNGVEHVIEVETKLYSRSEENTLESTIDSVVQPKVEDNVHDKKRK